jgi:3-phosphoshikimate 1-carboxyvinyltransferase
MSDRSVLRVRPAHGLNGTVLLPGDKSLSHRVLLLASLASGVSRIENFLYAGVTDAMIDCLKTLSVGVKVTPGENGEIPEASELLVHGCGLRGFARPEVSLDCRGSGTTMRLMAGVLAAQAFQSTLDGNDRLRVRPMGRVVEPLREKGARISTTNGNAPLTFLPSILKASEHELAVASAQVKSAILLAGLYSEGSTTVIEPHTSRDHTERLFRSLGLSVEEAVGNGGRHTVTLQGGVERLPALDLKLPADPSSAAFLTVAALIVPESSVVLSDLCLNPGRIGLYEVLRTMGANLALQATESQAGEPVGSVAVRAGRLQGTEVRGDVVTSMIDEFPIFAVAATQAHGITTVRDAAELRLKESDRIEALANELNKMGAEIETRPDGFTITGPKRLHGATVNARGDHRLAMSLAIAGLIAEGETHIEGWKILQESFPSFPVVLKKLGADLEW